jgi:uncharacterized protein
MATYFLDTSALAKRYIQREVGHIWMADICDPKQRHRIVISEAALVEAVATFCRMARETPPRLSNSNRDRFIMMFRSHIKRHYSITAITRSLLQDAGDLCHKHPLRAYDAVQLTSALYLQNKALAAKLPAPIFVCADANLLAIANSEGLAVENPNQYP